MEGKPLAWCVIRRLYGKTVRRLLQHSSKRLAPVSPWTPVPIDEIKEYLADALAAR